MRIQCTREAMMMLRALSTERGAVRRKIEALLNDPYPEDAREISGKPGVYELFTAGYWIAYRVDKSDPGETVIVILLVEEN